jgi:hypothetical protein
MKRLNPKTGKPFVFGDTRKEDDRLFRCYIKRLKKDGFFQEQWSAPDVFKRYTDFSFSDRYIEKYDPENHSTNKNPITGKNWIKGEIDKKTGKYFIAYKNTAVTSSKIREEIWAKDFDDYKFTYIKNINANLRAKSRQRNIIYDIDANYLKSIFPADGLCPALGIKLEFGGSIKHRQNSPSVDRIFPAKGYVRGNLRWVSFLANAIMNQANADQILRVGNWLKDQGNLKRNPQVKK